MDVLIKLQADELNSSLIDFIKSSFKGKRIAVHVYEEEMDETEYLLSNPQTRRELLESIEEVKKGNFKTYTLEEIKTLINYKED